MVFGIAEILSFLSEFTTSSRATSCSPGRHGASAVPRAAGVPRPGDVVEVEVEDIGVLRNPVGGPQR